MVDGGSVAIGCGSQDLGWWVRREKLNGTEQRESLKNKKIKIMPQNKCIWPANIILLVSTALCEFDLLF